MDVCSRIQWFCERRRAGASKSQLCGPGAMEEVDVTASHTHILGPHHNHELHLPQLLSMIEASARRELRTTLCLQCSQMTLGSSVGQRRHRWDRQRVSDALDQATRELDTVGLTTDETRLDANQAVVLGLEIDCRGVLHEKHDQEDAAEDRCPGGFG